MLPLRRKFSRSCVFLGFTINMCAGNQSHVVKLQISNKFWNTQWIKKQPCRDSKTLATQVIQIIKLLSLPLTSKQHQAIVAKAEDVDLEEGGPTKCLETKLNKIQIQVMIPLTTGKISRKIFHHPMDHTSAAGDVVILNITNRAVHLLTRNARNVT